MIAPIRQPRRCQDVSVFQAAFVGMLPAILRHARMAFRHLKGEARQEVLTEVVANAFVAYARLAELGKTDLAYPSVLVRYAVAQFCDGRRVGSRLNIRDVLSRHCQKRKGVNVERLDRFDASNDCWIEATLEDTHALPPDQAAFRIDFPTWLGTLSRRNRRVALTLASGESPGNVARQNALSPGRVSQLRRDLCQSWQQFHGEAAQPDGQPSVS